MASSWGGSWGTAWGNSWGPVTEPEPEPEIVEPTGAGGFMWGRDDKKINDDDRVIMAVINEFLRVVNE